jgi:hypothetical protein
MRLLQLLALLSLLTPAADAGEFHVSVTGDDDNDASAAKPFRTISAAARAAQPGDVITVHEGTYRERVTPPRGGKSDTRRIVYQAAPGEKVVIKGSEVVRDWKPFAAGVWKLTLPNSFFGGYNPYKELIAGDWFTDRGTPHHTGEVYLNGKSLYESHLLERVLHPTAFPDSRDREASTYTWFCESDDQSTYIYANFHEKNPNEELVEINVRESCFYPDRPGRDYITVRGFRMCHAATQWAAPTAEQIGLIGTHWSKCWIIENNVISDSKCTGITLGKDRATGHNVWSKEPGKDGATHYNEVVERALKAGWSREKIGSHFVRNNTIFDCEEAGICGSLGAVFSQITSNHIYNIWAKRKFGGAEMAAIKLHAAIDVLIRHNRLHHSGRALWLDWMAQGTRISGNLCYENTQDDLFLEVNHGPFLIDNNLLLSPVTLRDVSEGGAYAHNLTAGKFVWRAEQSRATPYHAAHSTKLAGLSKTPGGDDRFYNNILTAPSPEAARAAKPAPNPMMITGYSLCVYDIKTLPLQTGGNVYYNGAQPSARETNAVVETAFDPRIRIDEEGEDVYLHLTLGAALNHAETTLVTSELLGRTKLAGLAYENADGSRLIIDTDYFGKKRSETKPSAGPFENPGTGEVRLKVW